MVRLAELDGALKGQSRLAPDLELQRALVALSAPLLTHDLPRQRCAGTWLRGRVLGSAGDEPRGVRLLARGGVAVERAARRGTVDRAHELAMLGRDALGVAVGDGRLEALRQRLDRRAVAEVLGPLPLLDPDALLLLLDVRHSRKCPLLAGRAMVAGPTGRIGAQAGPMDTSDPDISNATPPDGSAHSRRLARSTAVFSLATGVSRVLGLVREMVSAYFFGVPGLINAFTVAIQIPNLVRALVADAALSGAFVPVFSELLEKGRAEARLARRLDALLADAARPRRRHRASSSCSRRC